jgi:hypothetical protein
MSRRPHPTMSALVRGSRRCFRSASDCSCGCQPITPWSLHASACGSGWSGAAQAGPAPAADVILDQFEHERTAFLDRARDALLSPIPEAGAGL